MASASEKKNAVALYDDLDRSMWITKHSRYNASDRLRRKHNLSIYTISILSIYVIALTLLEKYGLQLKNPDLYQFASICLGLFILVLSLTEANKNYLVSSERLFVCGNNIRELLDDLKKFSNKTDDDHQGIERISGKYSNILKTCVENHESIDYDLHRGKNSECFKGINGFYAFWFRVKYILNIYWFYFALIFLPPLIFWKLA
jgi:hypothetical protein